MSVGLEPGSTSPPGSGPPPADRPPALAGRPIHLLSDALDRAADHDPAPEAFVDPMRRLSRGEVLRRANGLAHRLADQGVRRGDRVGILMPRGAEVATAVHGILRCGAAFVPIDPHLAAPGVRRILATCGIRHLVTVPALASTVATLTAEPGDAPPLEGVIGLEAAPEGVPACASWDDVAAAADDAPPRDQRPVASDLAYVMFSSGSTGRPKGIMHTHRSGLAYAERSAATYDVRPDDRIANHSPLHFDMSTFGYLTAPWAGATTVVIPEAYTKLAASLSQLIAAERATIWYSVPLALVQLLQRGVLEDRDCSALRWVLYGGEPFPVRHLRALMEAWPHARVSNVYGPAEVNQCTFHHVPPLADWPAEDPDGIPIGPPWDGAEAVLVDADDAPVADGETGELLIHAETMMRGYWGRPDLDARAFARRPGPGGLERTFYRTGDLAWAEPDGTLHFVGRRDRQVKVRGHRIELDEIEAVLAAHPEVAEVGTYAVRERDETRRLEAALRPADDVADRDGLPSRLAAYAAEHLSSYAVPTAFVVRDALPRTGTGKIDRRRLEADAEERARTQA